MCAGAPWRPEEGFRITQVAVTTQCVCWQLNSVLQQEQQVLLTSEPTLQAPHSFFELRCIYLKIQAEANLLKAALKAI